MQLFGLNCTLRTNKQLLAWLNRFWKHKKKRFWRIIGYPGKPFCNSPGSLQFLQLRVWKQSKTKICHVSYFQASMPTLMWFPSLAECKEEVKCQVVYFFAIFLSQNNTEFAKSNLSLIIDRGIPLLGTLVLTEILWSGKRGVKSLLTILSKPKMSSETAALFSREIKKLFSFSSVHIPPFLIIFSLFLILFYCRWKKKKAETDKRTPRNSLFMIISFT